MWRKKGFSCLTKFLQPPKLVDGIFEISLHLQKFWWVQKIVHTRNGFALTDFMANETKFCVVRTGPYKLKNIYIFKRKLSIYICRCAHLPFHSFAQTKWCGDPGFADLRLLVLKRRNINYLMRTSRAAQCDEVQSSGCVADLPIVFFT